MVFKDWSGWTDWELLVHADLDGIPNSPGAYLIAAKAPINRAFGKDLEGILDVGESGKLKDRLNSFIACAQGRRKAGHMAGWRYYEFKLYKLFPLDTLYLSWCAATSKKKAYKLEEEVLKEYLKQHHELPPLNYKFNWASYKQ